jgi:hypothetical protein
MATKRKRNDVGDECCDNIDNKKQKTVKNIKITYSENLNSEKIKENDIIKKYNLISQDKKENTFPKKEIHIDKVLELEDVKDNITKFIYKIVFSTNNSTTSFKIGEIEINPILIKTKIRYFIIQNNDDNIDIENIKNNFNNNLKVTILLDETVELKNDLYPFTNHSININWNINDYERENLNKYYWGYQIIRPDFLNNINFGIKNLEEKTFITSGCNNNNNNINNIINDQISKFKGDVLSILEAKLNECQKK